MHFFGEILQRQFKTPVTLDSGRRAATGTYKAGKDFVRGGTICGWLCCVSIGCERFQDLCAQDTSSPLC